MTEFNNLTPYERGRLTALLGRGGQANPFPKIDDGVSDWAVWNDGHCHITEVVVMQALP
jgi:hypothetical protein